MRYRNQIATAVAAVLLSGAAFYNPLSDAAPPPPPPPPPADTLASTPVDDLSPACPNAADATVDHIIALAATAYRVNVPEPLHKQFDQQVNDFRVQVASLRVHREFIPVDPDAYGGRLDELDDPIVTYIVNMLDTVRNHRIEQSITVSSLDVVDVIEIFILGNRLVKIPTQLMASMVPTIGFFLRPIVGGMFTVVQKIARAIQGNLAHVCTGSHNYPKLSELGVPERIIEPIMPPQEVNDLAHQVMPADGKCTPIAKLTLSTVVERTRTYLHWLKSPDGARGSTAPLAAEASRVDIHTVDRTANAAQDFLHENRIAKIALARQPDELGPLVEAVDHGTMTYLVGIGFGLYEGKGGDTVPLSEVSVGSAWGLMMAVIDTTSLAISLGLMFGGGYLDLLLPGLSTAASVTQALAFAPTTYLAPIARGVMQTMCAT